MSGAGVPRAAPRFPPDSPADVTPVQIVVARSAPVAVTTAALAGLSAGERARAARFRRPQDAARFVTGRTVARRMLGERLGVAAEDVGLVVPQDGWKPRVPGTTLDVSIAHAGDVVLVALADGSEVGIDVEGGPGAVRAVDEATWRAATSRAERDAAGPLAWEAGGPPSTVDRVLRTWVRKEAVLKAVRLGLAVPMDALILRDGTPPGVLATPDGLPRAGSIALLDLDAPAGYRIALAAVTGRAVVARDAATGAVLARVAAAAGR